MCIGSFSLHSKWIGLSKRDPNSSVLRRDVESDRLIGNTIQTHNSSSTDIFRNSYIQYPHKMHGFHVQKSRYIQLCTAQLQYIYDSTSPPAERLRNRKLIGIFIDIFVLFRTYKSQQDICCLTTSQDQLYFLFLYPPPDI